MSTNNAVVEAAAQRVRRAKKASMDARLMSPLENVRMALVLALNSLEQIEPTREEEPVLAPEQPAPVIDADKLAKVAVKAHFESVASSLAPIEEDVADAIRAALPDATVPADRILGPTQVAVDLSWVPARYLAFWSGLRLGEYEDCRNPGAWLDKQCADAELARRGES